MKIPNRIQFSRLLIVSTMMFAWSGAGWSQTDDSEEGPVAPSYYDDEVFSDEESGDTESSQEDLDFLESLRLDGDIEEALSSEDPADVEVGTLSELPFLPQADSEDYGAAWDTAVFRGLDKITARVSVFEVPLNEPVAYGRFEVTVRRCNKRPPEEAPNTTAFVEVLEHTLDEEDLAVFSGWMFASSPGLHAVEHPVYDVWLIDCKANSPVSPFEAQSVDGEKMDIDAAAVEELFPSE